MQLTALASKVAWDYPVEMSSAHRMLGLLEEGEVVTSHKSCDSAYLCTSPETSATTVNDLRNTEGPSPCPFSISQKNPGHHQGVSQLSEGYPSHLWKALRLPPKNV